MGYANTKQTGAGIHTRLYSRAFIVDDGRQRVLFVTADVGMVSQRLRLEVRNALRLAQRDSIYFFIYLTNCPELEGMSTNQPREAD